MKIEDRLAVADWLARAALDAIPPEALLEGFARRLDAGGVRLMRAAATIQSLDPLTGALVFRWRRDRAEGRREAYDRFADGEEPANWRRSPFYALYHGRQTRLRFRLDDPATLRAYPLLAELRDAGATEYFAAKVAFAGVGGGEGVLSSWATDRPGGFATADLDALQALLPVLQLAFLAAATRDGAATLLRTYLGRDVAGRVLAGEVRRGVPGRLEAVLWASDLAGFTRLADREPEDRVIDLLNAYAEIAVDAVTAAGGEVLKFLGDGLLAVFDRAALAETPAAALGAAERALGDARALGEARRDAGLPASRLRIALHAGEVFYGNVGARTRLDFTAIGPAVNEAARLCEMCRSLDQELVVSAGFFALAGAERDRLVGLGRYALRGVARPQHLYTLEPATD